MISKKTGAEIALNIQYLKALSFDNIKAPHVYTYQDLKPDINVSLDLNATKLQKDVYEVEITINVDAKNNEESLFTIELIYAGIFTIKNVADNLIQENLFIDCPTIIFPFARRMISDITRDANLPSLNLDIVDFEQLYNSKKETLQNAK